MQTVVDATATETICMILEPYPDDLRIQTDARLDRLEKLAEKLDASFKIPFTEMRAGLDPVIGLIPGVGDVVMGCVSGWIVLHAWRLGASSGTISRMLWNVSLEVVIGSVPLVGDLFDMTWKANIRNVKLLRRNLYKQGRASRSSSLIEMI